MMVQPEPKEILQKGVLPENLPPIFSSTAIWTGLGNSVGSYLINAKCLGVLSSYNASKRGGQRRIFSLPHPAFIHDQVVFFSRHWGAMESLFEQAPGSLSRPDLSVGGSRAVRITPHSELPKARLKAFSRYKHCLVTDVARCFPSIYTHSIPWAINGRAAAKTDRKSNSATVFGNRLDFIVRQAQDGQTIGIPIGPDTSRIISELVLSAVDHSFLSRSGSKAPTYLRHVDDYWIGGHTVEECNKQLQNLRAALREYELDINELKTRVVSTSQVLGESWPGEFEKEIVQTLGTLRAFGGRDPISMFGKFIDRAARENDEGMIRHVIRTIDESRLWESNWDVLEHFLAHCSIQFPHSFDYVARVIAWRARTDQPYDRTLWTDIARSVAMTGSVLGHDSEVVWAIWLLKELSSKVIQDISNSIIANNGPLTLGCLAHLYANGLATDKEIPEKLWSRVDGNLHCGQHWPLTLELMHLQITGPAPPSTTETNLRVLHDARISLINWGAVPSVFLGDENEILEKPDRAIEDFSSDYDHDGGDVDDLSFFDDDDLDF